MALVSPTTLKLHDISYSNILPIRIELIKNWKPAHEVWSLNYGSAVVALISAANGIIINGMFRSKLKLMHQGFIFTNFFLSVAPSFSSYLTHKYFITDEILLFKKSCISCLQFKASIAFNCHGLLYPMLVAVPLNLIVAGNMGYRIPYLHEGKEVLKFMWSVTKPHFKQIAFMCALNTAVVSVITNKEVESMERIANIIHEVQRYIDDQEAQTNATQLEML